MPRKRRIDWKAGALELAAAIPRERFDPAVLRWMDRSSSRTPWCVAFSGGPDSLALLLLLWAHRPERRRRLRALHFDHRLRGAESRADAAFCRSVCTALRVKMISGAWAGRHEGASEAEARSARLAFFAKHARVIFLGHQQDDIAESMLMRLARGSGSGGLAAPRPVQPMPRGLVHLRPLLGLKKAEIVDALRRAGLTAREDSTNALGRFFRNRIRREVVPAWVKAAERDAVAGAARARQLLDEDDAALQAWLDELRPIDAAGRLQLAVLAGKPRALVRRALHHWLATEPPAGAISRQAFDALLEAVEIGRPTRHSVGRERLAVIDRKHVRFESARKIRRTFRRRSN